jgi:tRNA 2-selenouridine synthase
VSLELPAPERIRLLRDEYRHYELGPEQLCQQLSCLTALHGRMRVERWKALVQGASWDALVSCLLEEHYDPVYRRSIGSNYRRISDAVRLPIHSADCSDFEQAARQLAQIS